jgi:hypothetical protein
VETKIKGDPLNLEIVGGTLDEASNISLFGGTSADISSPSGIGGKLEAVFELLTHTRVSSAGSPLKTKLGTGTAEHSLRENGGRGKHYLSKSTLALS